MKKFWLGQILVSVAFFGVFVFVAKAEENTDNANVQENNVNRNPEIEKLRLEIAEMKKKHEELKAQVKAGEITKEEARKTWLALIEEMRVKKDMIIDARIQNISERLNSVKERKGEIMQVLTEFKQERKELILERKSIGEKVRKGEITKEEAKKMILENKEKRMKNRVEKKTEMKEIKGNK